MNILNTLTLKHLKLNRKRTIVTIIGVILSAAMMVAVTSLVVSVQDMLIRSAVERVGNWHGIYNDINKDQAKAIGEEKGIAKKMYSKAIGFAEHPSIKNRDKPYIFVTQYDKNSLENISRLKEGRIPKNDSEILIPEHLITNGKVQIKLGDTLTLNIGERIDNKGNLLNNHSSFINKTDVKKKLENIDQGDDANKKDIEAQLKALDYATSEKVQNTVKKTYTVVGITACPDILIEPYSSAGYTAVTYADTASIATSGNMDLAILMKSVSGSTSEKLYQFAQKNEIDLFATNADLLMAAGSFKNSGLNTVLYGSATVVILLIILGSVSLIYNAFSISVTDRLKQFGMLSSVGATKKQIRKSVRTEAAVVTAIGLPIGVLCGLAGIGITMMLINPLIASLSASIFESGTNLRLAISPLSILVAVFLVIVTVWISSAIPSKRAVSMSPVEAIKQSADIKMTKKKIKTSFITRKLFGIEGDIALKNLKRNRKKYRATVFSLIISIVLFVSVSSFTMYFQKSAGIGVTDYNYDMNVGIVPLQNNNTDNDKDKNERTNIYNFLDEVSKLDEVGDYSVITRNYAETKLDQKVISNKMNEKGHLLFENNKLNAKVGIFALDAATFKKYIAEIGENEAKYMDINNPKGILINSVNFRDETGRYLQTQQIDWNLASKDKATTTLQLVNPDNNKKSKIILSSATDKLPKGISYSQNTNKVWIVVSRDVGAKVTSDLEITPFIDMYLDTEKQSELTPKITDLFNSKSAITSLGGGMSIVDANEENTRNRQLLILASVFIYGFISLITLIGVANIFNTISTNITLRRREFAMLKSVGMTPASFTRMINFESIFYGLKSLLYGLPISFAVSYLLYRIFLKGIEFGFMLPWGNIAICILGVMVIVFITMLYSSSKIRKENIIDALRQENV